jgi:hypothetical protein
VQNILSYNLLFTNQKYTIQIKIYINIILLIVWYGCGTCSLTLRKERSLKVLENRVLRRVFGSKNDEVTGEWRKLHNEELMICTPHQIHSGDQIEKNELV